MAEENPSSVDSFDMLEGEHIRLLGSSLAKLLLLLFTKPLYDIKLELKF